MNNKKLLILLLLSISLEAANCWKIKNKDTQAYCEASSYGKKSCWKIKLLKYAYGPTVGNVDKHSEDSFIVYRLQYQP